MSIAGFLKRAAGAHELNSGLGNATPQNGRFVVALDRFLTKSGYLG